MRKCIPALWITLALTACLTGCADIGRGIIKELEDNKDGIKTELEELKDGFIAEFSDWMGAVSKYSITNEKDLKGRREFGVDEYVGSYEAQYTRFNGKEYIFGGTLMEREAGDNFIVLKGDDFTGKLSLRVE